MRICVTLDSNSPIIDKIYYYCQVNDIVMYPGPYIHVGDSYWTWRIETEPSKQVTWLLLCYGDYLTVF